MVTLKCLKLFSFIVILNVIRVKCTSVEITSFSRVAKNSDSINKQSREGNEKSTASSNSSHSNSWRESNTKPINIEPSQKLPEGRAIKSNYFPSLPNFMTKPVNSGSFKNEKGNKFIVYPSYNPNNIDQTRYDSRFATVPIAQRRFSPSEAYAGTVYKVKHAAQDSDYPKPIAADPPPSPTVSPIISMTPTQYLPPPQYLPPSKFYHPIVVYPPTTTTTEKASTVPTTIFLPTIQTEKTKRNKVKPTPKNSIADLSDFDKNINTSYVPSVLHSIREAMESSYINNELENISHNDTLTSEDLQRFPPNSNSIYLPQETKENVDLVNSYLPAPSGNFANKFSKDSRNLFDYTSEKGIAEKDLHKFPPNVDSAYNSENTQSNIELVNSYVPNPSGDNSFSIEPSDNLANNLNKNSQDLLEKIPKKDLHKFPPNVDSAYNSENLQSNINLLNSYVPNPSGDPNNFQIINQNKPFINDNVGDPSDFFNNQNFSPKENSQRHRDVDETTSLLIDLSVTELPENADPPKSSEVLDNSYIPPNNLHAFPPNLQSFYLPPEMMKHTSLINSYIPPPSGVKNIETETDTLTPPNIMMSPNANSYYYPRPGGGSMKPLPQPMPMMPMPEGQPPSSPGMMDLVPSGPPEDHHHHHHHHPWDYSDLIFDDHHHHHHHIEEETTTSTTAAPEEPRVKKYSYYYLGRKLWYIPLYFTFWFCLYVAALIIRSIGRHKVDLPNHYSRSLHDLSHPELIEKINKMTNFAMIQIEDFKEKYL